MTYDIKLKQDFDSYCEMLEMLGQPTVNHFAALSKDGRRNTFRRWLVENEPIEVDGFIEWQCCKAIRTFLLFKDHLEGNVMGQQLIHEARQVFYEENRFIMSSTLLDQFTSDSLGSWEKPVAVESLIRDITIRVDRRYCESENLALNLGGAFRLTDAERISIEVVERGVPNGSDLATQETIKNMSMVVKDLIGHFGPRLEVSKLLFWDADYKDGLTVCPAVRYDIKPYWSAPSDTARARMQKGEASFEEIMQVQIAEWTDQSYDPYPLNAIDRDV